MISIAEPIIAAASDNVSAFLRETTPADRRDESKRAWEAGKTTRLNSEHWGRADGATLNQDIHAFGDIVARRCEHEAENNPLIEGIINTFIDDVVGPDGPTLQVQSSSKRYSAALERFWSQWFESPDINGLLAGPEFIDLNLRMCFTRGEFINQIVVDMDAGGSMLATRLHAIHPRRLKTPIMHAAHVTLGVRRNETGRPLAYFIENDNQADPLGHVVQGFRELPPEVVIHMFRNKQPGQIRGVPWLKSALQHAADLRDYDAQVLDAARAAADHAVLLYTDHHDAEYIEVNEVTVIQRRQAQTIPPGWKAEQMKPQQPATNYVDYRSEMQRDIGRPMGMPLMTVRLDSSNHNYSSARFDGQVYQKNIRCVQKWLSRHMLNRLVREIEIEAQLAGLIPPRPREQPVKFVWEWPRAPHVDPKKEAEAGHQRLEDGSPLANETTIYGDWETNLAQLVREVEAFEEHGLQHPYLKPRAATGTETIDPDETDDDDDGDRPGANNSAPSRRELAHV